MPQATDSSVPGPAATTEQPQLDALGQPPIIIPPQIALAQETFYRDLPRLLQERLGQWVAYHGDRLVGFSKTKTELYRECAQRGLPHDEFLIRSIEPQEEIMIPHHMLFGQ